MWCSNGKPSERESRGYVVFKWKALRNRQQGLCGVRMESPQKEKAGAMWCVNGKPLEIDNRGYVVCQWKALRNKLLGLCGLRMESP